MTIKMRLDTKSLRDLIASNPELEVEIGREVVNNIRDDILRSKVEGQISACLRGMVTQQGGWPATFKATSPELVAAVKNAAEYIVNEVLTTRLEELIASRVSVHIAAQRAVDTRSLKEQLASLLTPEMARELMREKILL